jgi:hypothetical protein
VAEIVSPKMRGREDLSDSPLVLSIATFCRESPLVTGFRVVKRWVRKEHRDDWKISFKPDNTGLMVTVICAAGKTRMHLKLKNPTAVEQSLRKVFDEFKSKPR